MYYCKFMMISIQMSQEKERSVGVEGREGGRKGGRE